jgi:AraC-like DNA-binding protein
MLKNEQLRCGVYDSTVARKTETRTPQRTTVRYELELYHTQSGICYVDSDSYPVRRGMLLCTRPGQRRCSQLPIRSSYLWLVPDPDTEAVLQSLPVCTYLEDPEQIESLLQLFSKLYTVLAEDRLTLQRTVAANALLLQILQSCMSLSGGKRAVTGRLVREARAYMDAHFCEDCTLEAVAEHVHVSANHLHTVFLRSEGKTPFAYVLEKRLEKAKERILRGESSLAQIALDTGFCSQSHFTAAFKKSTGQTPARYRKQLFDIK